MSDSDKAIEQRCYEALKAVCEFPDEPMATWAEVAEYPREVKGWQAAAQVATDAERARCLAIVHDPDWLNETGPALERIRKRIESGEQP